MSTSLQALTTSSLPVRILQFTSNPVVISTLKIWSQFRKHTDTRETLLLQSPLCNSHVFLPAKLDQTFAVWNRKGILKFNDLYINGIFGSFSDLRSKYDLQQNDLFRYFQSRQFAKSHSPQFPSLPSKSLVDSLLEIPFWVQGFTSHSYSLILSMNNVKLEKIKTEWEKELGIEVSEEIWTEALQSVNNSTSCARLGLIQFKVVHWLHWSRAKVSSFYPEVDGRCVRCKTDIADLSHMFWTCH